MGDRGLCLYSTPCALSRPSPWQWSLGRDLALKHSVEPGSAGRVSSILPLEGHERKWLAWGPQGGASKRWAFLITYCAFFLHYYARRFSFSHVSKTPFYCLRWYKSVQRSCELMTSPHREKKENSIRLPLLSRKRFILLRVGKLQVKG